MPHSRPIPPYGVAIQGAIKSGDLLRMRTMVTDAEKYLTMSGETRGFGKSSEPDDADPDTVAAALDELKAEITKLERDR